MIRSSICVEGHYQDYSHLCTTSTLWPEDGQARPKHVVAIAAINRIPRQLCFWRTLLPSFNSELLLTSTAWCLGEGGSFLQLWRVLAPVLFCVEETWPSEVVSDQRLGLSVFGYLQRCSCGQWPTPVWMSPLGVEIHLVGNFQHTFHIRQFSSLKM
jgi:hypothetical protein